MDERMSTMGRGRDIRIYTTIDVLDWKGEIVRKTFERVVWFDDFDSRTFMKALDCGNLDDLPNPTNGVALLDIWPTEIKMYDIKCHSFDVKCRSFDVKSEILLGTIRFVAFENGNSVMRWRYSRKEEEDENRNR